MATKKLLAPFDPAKPDRQSRDFLVPELLDDEARFVGITGGNFATHGMVVFVGREVTPNDVFAKLVDAGRKFESVSETLEQLADFLTDLGSFKVGDVVEISTEPTSPHGYLLKKSSLRPRPAKKSKKLP